MSYFFQHILYPFFPIQNQLVLYYLQTINLDVNMS